MLAMPRTSPPCTTGASSYLCCSRLLTALSNGAPSGTVTQSAIGTMSVCRCTDGIVAFKAIEWLAERCGSARTLCQWRSGRCCSGFIRLLHFLLFACVTLERVLAEMVPNPVHGPDGADWYGGL